MRLAAFVGVLLAAGSAASIDASDRAALQRLQRANLLTACPKLLSWGSDKTADPCEWAGVTCVGDRVDVIDLRYCGLTVLPPEGE